ncbi:hypothetical protein [Streptomyces sp. MZ04]|uniref:hypothetical protein n=1 Tax=Streptomyces sp. MZ04 TaxID=2559236 RepID=UPI00107E6701|nr:hypothetical protein [Streptomyces sp. MZ04]TGA92813.1 hypothetical protein E2651_36230 [Streptomyces sp. MZ04]
MNLPDRGAVKNDFAATPAASLAAATPELLTTDSVIDPLLDALDEDQLGTLATRIRTRRIAKVQARLLAALREDSTELHRNGLTDCPEPVTRIRFTTHNNDPVCWDDNALVWHQTGATTRVDYAGTDVERALRDYSSFTDPVEGTRLVVDLSTGQFDVRGPWEPG